MRRARNGSTSATCDAGRSPSFALSFVRMARSASPSSAPIHLRSISMNGE